MSSFHFPAAAVCYWVCAGGFAFLRGSGSQKSGGGLAVWDCLVPVIKTPQESLTEWRKHRRKKRQKGQRIGETEVGGGGQWAFWWGLSGEHMWVIAWINTLSLPCTDDLHAEHHFYCLCSQISLLHTDFHTALKKDVNVWRQSSIVPFHKFMNVAPL